MPIYCYTSAKGKRIEELHPIGKAPKEVVKDGVVYDRDIQAEHSKQWTGDLWPIYSEAAGVHPSQVQEAQENWKKKGVPTEFTPDGRAVFRNKSHRRDFLRAAGLHDKAGYY